MSPTRWTPQKIVLGRQIITFAEQAIPNGEFVTLKFNLRHSIGDRSDYPGSEYSATPDTLTGFAGYSPDQIKVCQAVLAYHRSKQERVVQGVNGFRSSIAIAFDDFGVLIQHVIPLAGIVHEVLHLEQPPEEYWTTAFSVTPGLLGSNESAWQQVRNTFA